MDKLLGLFGIHRAGMMLTVASQVLRTFEQEFQKDHDAKNAAIDSFIELLKKHKDPVQNPVPPLEAPVA